MTPFLPPRTTEPTGWGATADRVTAAEDASIVFWVDFLIAEALGIVDQGPEYIR